VALAEHLTLEGTELAGLLLAGLSSAALLLLRGLGLLCHLVSHRGGALAHLNLLHLLGVLARHLDSLLGRLKVLDPQLLEGQVVVSRDAQKELAITLLNQSKDGRREVGHCVFVLVCQVGFCLSGSRNTRVFARVLGEVVCFWLF